MKPEDALGRALGESLGIVARSKRRRDAIPAEEVDRLYKLLLAATKIAAEGQDNDG